jgi:hypothetical protein
MDPRLSPPAPRARPAPGLQTGAGGLDPLASAPHAARLLAGGGRRAWCRVSPPRGRPCEVAVAVDGARLSSAPPVDLSLGGCAVVYAGPALSRGASARVELALPGVNVLLDAVVAWSTEGKMGLAFLPGPALDAATVPLQAYLLVALDEQAPAAR